MLDERFDDDVPTYPWGNWWTGFDWEQTRESVDRESRGRILLMGRPNAGKSTLLNRLRGWVISPPNSITASRPDQDGQSCRVEDFGLFCLLDLPEAKPKGEEPGPSWNGLDPFELADQADLLVYLLDGATGIEASDYRWIGQLRRLGRPLVVTLNKSDLVDQANFRRLTEIEDRLATSLLPISALQGDNVMDRLLPRMVDACPSLAVPLGRELGSFRRQAAGRVIRRTAVFNGLIALEPVPLLDIPLQMATLVGMVLRIAAVYDRPPTDAHRKEVVAAMAGGLFGRYVTQQIVKLIPFVGWIASGFIGMSCTWLLGRAAVAYFEAGGDATVTANWERVQTHLRRDWRHLQPPWHRWVRHRIRLRRRFRQFRARFSPRRRRPGPLRLSPPQDKEGEGGQSP